MLPYVIGGGVFLVLLTIILTRFLNREARWLKLLQIYEKRNDYLMAIDYAKKLTELRKYKPDYWMKLAELYEKSKLRAAAIEIYDNMIKNKIFSAKFKEHNIREQKALLEIEDGKIIDAFKELYLITKTNPKSPLALALLGRIYGSQLKYDKAKEYLTKAIQIKDDIAEFHYLLGILYLDMGELSQAIVELDKAYNLDPNHIKAAYFLALACRQKGLNDKAKFLFEKLNLRNLSGLPTNVTQIAIMSQNIPQFNIEELENSIKAEEASLKEKIGNKATSIEELLNADTTTFYNTAVSVISKLGYIIKKEVKSQLIDPSSQLNFIAISKKNKDKPDAPLCFIEFHRTSSEIGSIPLADFISKIKENKASTGILITTSTFISSAQERISKEKVNITLIDHNKLVRYL